MCPDCSPPSRLPAPRISRSFIATAIPAPRSACCAMVASRSCAVSVSGFSGGKKKYAYARSRPRPTRPRSWCSWDRPSRSERSTISVFAFEMSMPDSTIVVQTMTSDCFSQKPWITCSSWCSGIWPCATLTRASGTSWRIRAAAFSIVFTRLWTKKTWPSRSSSRRIAAVTWPSSYAPTKVSTGCRSSGGVAIVDISRMPVIDISSVRGIGVADIVSTSTAVRSCFSCSLCSTPNRCSSSTTTSPRSLNATSPLNSRCVPITTSTDPSARPSIVALASLSVWNRDSGADVHRERGVPLGEGRVVLLHEQRGRHQYGDLLAVLHRLEGRPYGDLRLAVADVAADDPVHRRDAFHVVLHVVDGGELVRRLHERERVLELALPRGVLGERVALGRLARGVQLDQLAGDLADRLAGAALALGPVAAAHLVQRRLLAADVPGDLVELVGRHVQPVAGLAALARRELDHDVLAGGLLGAGADGALHHLDVPADAVLFVHDVVAGLQLQRVDRLLAAARHPLLGTAFGRRPLAGQVVLGEYRELDAVGNESVFELHPARSVRRPARGSPSIASTVRAGSSASENTSASRWAGP